MVKDTAVAQEHKETEARPFPLEQAIAEGEKSARYQALMETLRQQEKHSALLAESMDDRLMARKHFHIAECCRVARKVVLHVESMCASSRS